MDLENCKILLSQDKLYNLIAYHAQQVVEKSLKAFLAYNGEIVGNYHDTKSLCIKAEKIISDFKEYRDTCSDLANVYIITHYPDMNDDVIIFSKDNVNKYFHVAEEIYKTVIENL